MDIQTLALIPKRVTEFLNFKGNFTGHCFHRSTATILSKNAATSTQLKTLMYWKSENTDFNYVDNIERAIVNLSQMLSNSSSNNETKVKSSRSGSKFKNCVKNFN